MVLGQRVAKASAATRACRVASVTDLLVGQVGLDLVCLDRLYVNGYVPNRQVGGQVVTFLTHHLGYPIPSPVVFNQIGERFRRAVGDFADRERIPVVRFAKSDRKADVMGPYLRRAAVARSPRSGSRKSSSGCSPATTARPTGLRHRTSRSTRPSGGSVVSTSICGAPTSARHSSRYAPTSHIPSKKVCLLTEPPTESLHVTGQGPVRLVTVPTRDRQDQICYHAQRTALSLVDRSWSQLGPASRPG